MEKALSSITLHGDLCWNDTSNCLKGSCIGGHTCFSHSLLVTKQHQHAWFHNCMVVFLRSVKSKNLPVFLEVPQMPLNSDFVCFGLGTFWTIFEAFPKNEFSRYSMRDKLINLEFSHEIWLEFFFLYSLDTVVRLSRKNCAQIINAQGVVYTYTCA